MTSHNDKANPPPYRCKEVIGDCTLYLGDCADILFTLTKADAIVTDPPYGIGEARGKNKSRSVLANARDYGISDWDDEPCQQSLIELMRACSKHQIIFGGKLFHSSTIEVLAGLGQNEW